MPYSIGIDYGTNSVRAVVVDTSNGREVGSSVVDYPGGKAGILLDPRDHHLARQSPGDYLFGLEEAVKKAVARANGDPDFKPTEVIGIGVDSTGSSPLPVDEHNVPLALHDRWKNHLAAQCWLWKDHTSHREAARNHGPRRRAPAPVHRQVRQHVQLRVVLEQNLALPERRARGLRRRP